MGSPVPLDTAARRRTRARARSALAAARRRWLSPQRLLIACLVAVVAAAVLVVYLERRAAALQRARTDMVLRQVCERTAAALATRTRELFGAAVLGTIESIGHREIEQYNLARVDRALAAGTRQHAYVDRYFFWHERMAPRFGQQLLFYRPAGEAGATDVPAGAGWRRLLRGAGPGRRSCGGSANACARRAKPSRSRRSCSTACRTRRSSTTCGRTRSGPRRSRSSASSSISTSCGPTASAASRPPASSRSSTWAPICRAWRCASRTPPDVASPGRTATPSACRPRPSASTSCSSPAASSATTWRRCRRWRAGG